MEGVTCPKCGRPAQIKIFHINGRAYYAAYHGGTSWCYVCSADPGQAARAVALLMALRDAVPGVVPRVSLDYPVAERIVLDLDPVHAIVYEVKRLCRLDARLCRAAAESFKALVSELEGVVKDVGS